jgi:hypothetical protein
MRGAVSVQIQSQGREALVWHPVTITPCYNCTMRQHTKSSCGPEACSSNDAGIAVTPIMTITGVGESSAGLDYQHGAVAIMLDLMNPVSAFRRLVGQARKAAAGQSKGGKGETRLVLASLPEITSQWLACPYSRPILDSRAILTLCHGRIAGEARGLFAERGRPHLVLRNGSGLTPLLHNCFIACAAP